MMNDLKDFDEMQAMIDGCDWEFENGIDWGEFGQAKNYDVVNMNEKKSFASRVWEIVKFSIVFC